jgi:putative membrane protein
MIARLPALNAVLNFSSAVFLVAGYLCIRRGRVQAHRACMGTAFTLSIFFLISYLTYHAHVGNVRFLKQGWIRPVYFGILISHTILAVVIVPLAIRTLYLALKSRFAEHRAWARWTLPIWFYVSVTGVIIYEMLY